VTDYLHIIIFITIYC